MRNQVVTGVLAGLLGVGTTAWADEIRASDPQGLALSVYDTGVGMVSELRRLVVERGANEVRFENLPPRLDPATASFSSLGAGAGFEIKAQRFEFDRADPLRILTRYEGSPITVNAGGTETEGILVGTTGSPETPFMERSLILKSRDGGNLIVRDIARLDGWVLPRTDRPVYLDPILMWTLQTASEGPQSLRLNYLCEGLSWECFYEAWMSPNDASAFLSVRAAVRNESGGRFKDARLKLVSTQQGIFPPMWPSDTVPAGRRDTTSQVQSYVYGASEPAFQKMAASAAALKSYDLPDPVTLEPGVVTYVQIRQAENLPARRLLVYDGVKFDRFQRNRRNDWNYGTEFRPGVEQYLQFSNSATAGLGLDLPPGRLRLYRQASDGTVDLAGQEFLAGVPPGGMIHVPLGPAKGMGGERERTGYNEVVPLHEYEESFEIRLSNESEEPAMIAVVEHLYRGADFQIVKSDSDYTLTAPQTLEFLTEVKPGGKRSLHYTVRYKW